MNETKKIAHFTRFFTQLYDEIEDLHFILSPWQ